MESRAGREIVSEAGHAGKITIATNMAGRGTDIKLGLGVADKGGLHVLATERHEAHRIDRQLYGRAARQGDPGSAQAFISAEDELLRRFVPEVLRSRLEMAARRKWRATQNLAAGTFKCAQFVARRQAFRQRRQVLKFDTWLAESLSFAGSAQTYSRSTVEQ